MCIGEALIDMICTDKGSSLSDGQHFLKKPGGAPTNVSAAIGALGGDVSAISINPASSSVFLDSEIAISLNYKNQKINNILNSSKSKSKNNNQIY